MLLVIVSAGAGSAITLAIVLHYLLYLRNGKDPNLKRLTIVMYGTVVVLSVIAFRLSRLL